MFADVIRRFAVPVLAFLVLTVSANARAGMFEICNASGVNVRVVTVDSADSSRTYANLPAPSNNKIYCTNDNDSTSLFAARQQDGKQFWVKPTPSISDPWFCVSEQGAQYVSQIVVPCPDGATSRAFFRLKDFGASGTVRVLPDGEIEYLSPEATASLTTRTSTGPQTPITVCNKSGNTTRVAVGYYNNGSWRSEGWWVLPQLTCASRPFAEYDRGKALYIAVRSEDGTKDWSKFVSKTGTFCGHERISYATEDKKECAVGFKKITLSEVRTGGRTVGAFEIQASSIAFNPNANPSFPPPPKTMNVTFSNGVIESRCLFRWDDSHAVHSVRTVWRLDYQATKTTMRKLEHCVRLDLVGPVDVEGMAKSYMDTCINEAFAKNRVRHALEALVALGSDVFGPTAGAATVAKITTYVNEVANNTIDCLTDADRIEKHIGAELKNHYKGTVHNESKWIYWEL